MSNEEDRTKPYSKNKLKVKVSAFIIFSPKTAQENSVNASKWKIR